MDSSGLKDKKSIPKFGSFRLPATPAATIAKDRRDRDSDRDRQTHDRDHDSRPSKRRRGDDRNYDRLCSPRRSPNPRRRKPTSRRSRSLDARSSEGHQHTHTRHVSRPRVSCVKDNSSRDTLNVNPFPEADLQEDHGFFIDSKGDQHNLTYGPSHRYFIPAFHRAGSGNVLGNTGNYKIDRSKLTEGTVVLRPNLGGTGCSTTTSDKPLSNSLNAPDQVFRIANITPYSVQELQKDFITLKPAIRSYDGPADIEGPADSFIQRQIEDEDRERDDLQDDEAFFAHSQVDIDDERKTHHAQLQRDIKSHPTEVAPWLRLIDYQEILIRGSRDDSSLLTLAERHGLADLKLSLYEKALKKVGNNPHRDILLLGRLEVGSQLWGTDKLLKEWDRTLHDNPGYMNLWVKYINFRQTEPHDFTFNRCLTVYLDSLELSSQQGGPQKSQIQCYILLRLTLFLREAGFTELSVGIWQAVLELTCLKPPAFPGIPHEKNRFLSSFARFWESEAPRIGELGSKGWGTGISSELDPEEIEFEFEIDPWDVVLSWTRAEREHIVKCRIPERSVDGSGRIPPGSDEVHKVVVMKDLHKILPAFWDYADFDELIDAFLYYSHLPHMTTPENLRTTRKWSWDSFLRNEELDNVCYRLEKWVPPQRGADQHEPSPVSPFTFRVDNFLHNTDTFFARPNCWFSSFRSFHPGCPSHISSIDYNWVRHTIRQLANQFPDDAVLTEYLMALEFAFDPKNAIVLAKSVLKKRPSSLRLWNACALIIAQMGDVRRANDIFDVALSNTQELSESGGEERVLLWHSWVWELLDRGQNPQASYLLYGMATGDFQLAQMPQQTTPIDFSLACFGGIQEFFENRQLHSLHHGKAQLYVAYTTCLGLWYHLTDHMQTAALSVYSKSVHQMRRMSAVDERFREYTTELLHQARARFIHLILTLPSMQLGHMYREVRARKSHLCTALRESLLLFPNNTIFLALYMWSEARSSLLDRLRGTFALTGPAKCSEDLLTLPALAPRSVAVSTHLFSIFMEVCRPTYTGASRAATRAAFERAIGEQGDPTEVRPEVKDHRHSLSADNIRSNLAVWKVYLLWELYHCGSTEAAKAVFFRAVRACPWSKEIIMLGFELLRDDIPQGPNGRPEDLGLQGVELRQLYNTVYSRQLRIFVPMRDPEYVHGRGRWPSELGVIFEDEPESAAEEHSEREKGLEGDREEEPEVEYVEDVEVERVEKGEEKGDESESEEEGGVPL